MRDRRSWERAPKRDVSINRLEKRGTWNEKISSCLCLTVEHTDWTLNINKCS